MLKSPMKLLSLCRRVLKSTVNTRCHVHYVQGQRTPKGVREYFYYIDHRGQLFLDDARIKNFTSCFKEKQFLKFFFNQLKVNNIGRYENDFPFLSPCGLELNFIRCDDLPVVFEKILTSAEFEAANCMPYPDNQAHVLMYGGGQMSIPFVPSDLLVDPLTGRVYHPAPDKFGGLGLVGSNLAQHLSESFVFETTDKFGRNGNNPLMGGQEVPTHINWNGVKIKLANNYTIMEKITRIQGPKSNAL